MGEGNEWILYLKMKQHMIQSINGYNWRSLDLYNTELKASALVKIQTNPFTN